MENILYNELRTRGYSVDVGSVEKRSVKNGKTRRTTFEVDFVAHLGSQRFYLQSALQLPDAEKIDQETASLRAIDDSFKKIVVVREVMKPVHDENGILFMSVYDFLLQQDSLYW